MRSMGGSCPPNTAGPMRADLLLARAWDRARVLPEAALEDALAAALEATDAWPRMVRHFRWPLPKDRPKVTTQDRVEEGRSDIRLTFTGGERAVLELKAGPAPGLHQLRKYEEGARVVGIATTPRLYPSPALVGSTLWSDLRAMPWLAPPLPWRQLLHLMDTIGVTVPPVDVSALTGLFASYSAFDTFTDWSREAADHVAHGLSTGSVRFDTKDKERGRRFDERAHRRQVSWAWAPPWRRHPWTGVPTGLYFGFPSAPVLVPGLPDLLLMWHCPPDSPLHPALRGDAALVAAATRWSARTEASTFREWRPGDWPLLWARCSTSVLLGAPEPAKVYLAWVDQVVSEWNTEGIADRLRAHLATTPAATGATTSDDLPDTSSPPCPEPL